MNCFPTTSVREKTIEKFACVHDGRLVEDCLYLCLSVCIYGYHGFDAFMIPASYTISGREMTWKLRCWLLCSYCEARV